MRALDEVLRADAPGHHAERFEKAWACTGCGACRALCLLDNPVADTLFDGRADAFANDLAPPAVKAFLRDEAATDGARRRARASLDAEGATHATLRYMPGCAEADARPEQVRDAAEAVGLLGRCGCGVSAEVCCGAKLHDAGDRLGLLAQARRFAESVRGVETLVVGDADCLAVLRSVYPRLGVTLPKVEHLSEFAEAHLDRLGAVEAPQRVVWHDPCKLGRGLGVYDAPRRVLSAVLGRPVGEAENHRDKALCSGGGGLVPLTRPETAREIAAMALAELAQGGDTVVVVGCASSRARFAEAGAAVEDFATWVLRGARAGAQRP